MVTLLLVYIIPRNFFRRFKKKRFKDFLREDILGSDDSNRVKAISIGLGVFIGIAPLWGLQSFLSIFLAITFRLNKVLAFTFSNVSIPPMIPIIVFASLQLGYYLVPHGTKDIILDEYSIASMSAHLVQYLVGSIVLASVMSVLFGTVSYVLLSVFNKKRK